MSQKLLLVKHSLPEKQPDLLAAQWGLSARGRELCTPLATNLLKYAPTQVFASTEPKATQTGQIVAANLQIPFETQPGLHEHVRDTYYPTEAEFEAAVARFFTNPDELVMGKETALAAQARFTTALLAILEKATANNLVVVAHGTVITLFVAAHNSINHFQFWRNLGLPSIVTLELPGFRLLEVVEQICPADL